MANDYQDWTRKVVIPVSFRSLTDTPGNFDGAAKKAVIINDTETALVYSNTSVDDHSARHENGGADKISVAGLSGVLADEQNPVNHASEHEAGGSDELGPIGNRTNGVIRLINPAGAADMWDTKSETGVIQIALPAAKQNMIFFRASVYEYNDRQSFDVIIAGYLYTDGPRWVNATAVIIGDSANTLRVRFCRNSDSSVWYVIIGYTDTSWAYPWIAITDFKVGYSSTISDWDDNWAISLVTSIPSYTDVDYTDARVTTKNHASRHEDGGSDPISTLGGNVGFPDRSFFHLILSSDQDIPADTWTKVNLDNADIDNRGECDTVNNYWIAGAAGYYYFYAQVYLYNSNATGDLSVNIYRVGVGSGPLQTTGLSDDRDLTLCTAGIFHMEAGEAVRLDVYRADYDDVLMAEVFTTYLMGFRIA